MATDPVLVEATRGGLVESVHRGAFVVMDADGAVVAEAGDIDGPVFPRSAIKLLQAIPLVESGAADALGFGARELAMACSSHSSEPGHVELARAMLARVGLCEDALECGAHWPLFGRSTLIDLARSGEVPCQLHNNCSGKHAGLLCTLVHRGIEARGYVEPDHYAMQAVRGVLEDVLRIEHTSERMGIDGCGIPSWAVPLRSLASAYARVGAGVGMERERGVAARRLLDATMAEPWLVAGTDRFDTRAMKAAPGRLHVKTGAEGVYCASLPDRGLGLALKIADGATRASECAVAALAGRWLGGGEGDAVAALAHRTLRNWNGTEVGVIRPAGALA